MMVNCGPMVVNLALVAWKIHHTSRWFALKKQKNVFFSSKKMETAYSFSNMTCAALAVARVPPAGSAHTGPWTPGGSSNRIRPSSKTSALYSGHRIGTSAKERLEPFLQPNEPGKGTDHSLLSSNHYCTILSI